MEGSAEIADEDECLDKPDRSDGVPRSSKATLSNAVSAEGEQTFLGFMTLQFYDHVCVIK